MTWMTIKVPRMLYLPVILGEGFKNSGMKIEPRNQIHDDEGTPTWIGDVLEILPGSNKIRVNGVEYKMLIPCDNLMVDAQGFIRLSKPRPPIALSSGGVGQASVAATGKAQANARGNWEQDAKQDHTKNRTARGGDSAFPDQEVSFNSGKFDQTIQDQFGTPNQDFTDEEATEALHQKAHYRPYQMKDGSLAQIQYDPKSGKDIGTPFRNYQATYDANGNQLGNPIPTRGKNPTFNEDEYRKQIKAQKQHAVHAPTARERYEADTHTQTMTSRPPQATQRGATSTGVTHLDNLIGSNDPDLQGWPLRRVSHLYGTSIRSIIEANHSRIFADSMVNAIGKIHMLKDHERGPIYVQLHELTDELRLSLAEELPVIIEITKTKKVAVVIVSPPWNEMTPALLKYLPVLRVRVEPHEDNTNFITAHIDKNDPNKNTINQTASFPKP